MPLAVDKTRNPIKVTGTTTADTKISDEITFIKFVYWYGPTTIDHLLALKDKDGGDIIPMKCEVAKESQMWPIWSTFHGIRCDDMDSGTLYIYIA